MLQTLFPVYSGHGVEKSFPDSLRPARPMGLLIGNAIMSLAKLVGAHDGSLSTLDPVLIVKRAQRNTGLTNFDDPHDNFFENLRKTVESIESYSKLSSLGRYIIHHTFVAAATNRLRIADYIGKNPSILDEKIKSPIIILGMGRTGTTFLHGLLSCDERLRSPGFFEMAYPQYPPLKNGVIDKNSPDFKRAVKELDQWKAMINNLDESHYMEVTMAEECLVLLIQNLSSLSLSVYGAYDFLKWYMSKKPTDAFVYHKKFLQYLQSNSDSTRWLLKSPWHMNHIDTIKEFYPDAKFIWTHRDPKEALPSWCSLVTKIFATVTNHIDLKKQGKENLELFSKLVSRAVEQVENLPESDVAHVAFRDIREQPMSIVEDIYRRFDMELTPSLRSKMEQYIEDYGKQATKVGKHKHQLDWFHLTKEDVDQSFSDYLTKYEKYLRR
eukprot:TRINITY_DN9884_c0_g1_i2.p1 TRINITY_DN9884_c0_g1~~TRINITY_DN9884_c0_g1_i2.p1  ORF type:complete len:439 (+),score=60.92 TRINITY_DN9884_c0_g1_i2:56-1372(+)